MLKNVNMSQYVPYVLYSCLHSCSCKYYVLYHEPVCAHVLLYFCIRTAADFYTTNNQASVERSAHTGVLTLGVGDDRSYGTPFQNVLIFQRSDSWPIVRK